MILVFGKTGQVARELSHNSTGFGDIIFLDRNAADLSDPAACVAAIHDHKPDAVINAAAYTAVDHAEENEALADIINAQAPGAMAVACAKIGIPFVHISTDYVFNGAGNTAFKPNHPCQPLGAYGRTKLAGELAVAKAGGLHAIFRTSWVISAHGNNFVKTMLRLGNERDQLSVVADQIGGPTAAVDIAKLCFCAVQQLDLDPTKSGIYHISGGPDVSWADLAREVFAQTGIDCTVNDIPTKEYPTPAKRPLNSRLDNTETTLTFGFARPDWRQSLTEILADLGALKS